MTSNFAKNYELPMTLKPYENDKYIKIAGNLSFYIIRTALTVCIMHQLDVLAKFPDVKLYFL